MVTVTEVVEAGGGIPLSKRLFDVVAASLLLLAVLPVLVLAAVAIKVQDGGPVLFRQRRVGHRGRQFQILKLRSMRPGAEEEWLEYQDRNVTDGLLFRVDGDPRVTAVGRVIRRLAIDELPQLWNVLRGDMSLVGPRPLAARPGDFTPAEDRRHDVLPGITGFWQVSGGNRLTYREMVDLDLAYVERWSLWLDVRLLAATLPALVRRGGPT